jgi:hypothetical protein
VNCMKSLSNCMTGIKLVDRLKRAFILTSCYCYCHTRASNLFDRCVAGDLGSLSLMLHHQGG